jgi:hypothetical protein
MQIDPVAGKQLAPKSLPDGKLRQFANPAVAGASSLSMCNNAAGPTALPARQVVRRVLWAGPDEVGVLADGPGFAWHDSESESRIIYSGSRGRFELVLAPRKSGSHVLRAPLARIASPTSPEDDSPRPPMRIGIPSWH